MGSSDARVGVPGGLCQDAPAIAPTLLCIRAHYRAARGFSRGRASIAYAVDAPALGAAQGMFDNAKAFNADISSWNVSKVTSMRVRQHTA